MNSIALVLILAAAQDAKPARKVVFETLRSDPRPEESLAGPVWSPDGKRLAWPDDKKLLFYDTTTWKVADEVAISGYPRGIAFSPDGSLVAAREPEAVVIRRMDDLKSEQRIPAVPCLIDLELMAFLDKNHLLYEGATKDGGMRIFSASCENGRWIAETGLDGGSMTFDLNPGRKWLALHDGFGIDSEKLDTPSVVIRDAVSLKRVAKLPIPRRTTGEWSTGGRVRFSADGRYVAYSGENDDLLVVETATWKTAKRWEPFGAHGRGVIRFRFSPDSAHLFTIDEFGRTIRAWSTATWELASETTLPAKGNWIDVSSDGRILVECGPTNAEDFLGSITVILRLK